MLKKDSSAKAHSRQSENSVPANPTRPSCEDMDKEFGLFGYESDDYHPYLELPIKIETRKFNRRRRQSDSYSEDPQSTCSYIESNYSRKMRKPFPANSLKVMN
jgi:hypothetical protein